MKIQTKIISLSLALVILVGIIVFSVGNSQSSPPVNITSNSSSQQEVKNVSSQALVSLTELSSHNSKNDCWVSYKGKVYDITLWLPQHPGSSAVIEPSCGTAEQFEKFFTNKHGQTQVERLMEEGIYKGDLAQ